MLPELFCVGPRVVRGVHLGVYHFHKVLAECLEQAVEHVNKHMNWPAAGGQRENCSDDNGVPVGAGGDGDGSSAGEVGVGHGGSPANAERGGPQSSYGMPAGGYGKVGVGLPHCNGNMAEGASRDGEDSGVGVVGDGARASLANAEGGGKVWGRPERADDQGLALPPGWENSNDGSAVDPQGGGGTYSPRWVSGWD